MKERFDQSDKYWDRTKSHLDQREKKLDEMVEEMRDTDQRLASLEHDAAMSCHGGRRASRHQDSRAHEGAAKAVQAMHEDSFSANWVDPDPMCSTSFGVKVEPPSLSCRDDVVVENGAAAPKSCLSSLEMRTTTAAGGLLPTGETSTATSTTFDHSTL